MVTDNDIRDRIVSRQLRVFSEQQTVTMLGAFGVALLIAFTFWNTSDHTRLFSWLAASMILLAVRFPVNRHLQRLPNSGPVLPTRIIQFYRRWFFTTMLIAGLLWAAATVLFFTPEEPVLVFFLVCMYAGLISAASISLPVYMPAYLAFIIPASLPFSIRCMIEGGTVFSTIGISVLVYFFANLMIARVSHGTLLRMFRLEISNEQLLSDLRHQTSAAERHRRQAEHAVDEKNRFLAAASHDLRQPLHAAGLLAEVLSPHVKGADGRRILDGIRESLQGLSLSFKGMLDLSRLDAGVVDIHATSISLRPVLERLLREFELQAREKRLDVHLDCDDIVVHTDAVLLQRILRNLLSNAIKYTESGGVSVHCRPRADHYIALAIIDTGIGIAADEQNQVFSEYYQIGNPERDRSRGLGLGLAIAKRLCDLLGINITLTSTHGEGTRFDLSIPTGTAVAPDEPRDEERQRDWTPTRILVIDDDDDILEGMRRLLDMWGCDVITARSALDANRALQHSVTDPDIILADYRLEDGLSGIQAVERVREELNVDIPALIITGDTSPRILSAVEQSGHRVVHKPIEPQALREEIDDLVQLARSGINRRMLPDKTLATTTLDVVPPARQPYADVPPKR